MMSRISRCVLFLALTLLLVVTPVRSGWWPFGKSTEQKRKAAVCHGKKAWSWGNEYSDDKYHDLKSSTKNSYDKAKSKAGAAADETEKTMKHAKEKVAENYDTLREHAKKVADKAGDTADEAAEAVDETIKQIEEDVSERVERTGRLFERAKDVIMRRSSEDEKTFAERYEEEKAQTEERQRNWFK